MLGILLQSACTQYIQSYRALDEIVYATLWRDFSRLTSPEGPYQPLCGAIVGASCGAVRRLSPSDQMGTAPVEGVPPCNLFVCDLQLTKRLLGVSTRQGVMLHMLKRLVSCLPVKTCSHRHRS